MTIPELSTSQAFFPPHLFFVLKESAMFFHSNNNQPFLCSGCFQISPVRASRTGEAGWGPPPPCDLSTETQLGLVAGLRWNQEFPQPLPAPEEVCKSLGQSKLKGNRCSLVHAFI